MSAGRPVSSSVVRLCLNSGLFVGDFLGYSGLPLLSKVPGLSVVGVYNCYSCWVNMGPALYSCHTKQGGNCAH